MSRTYATFDPSLALKDANTVVYATATTDINRTARCTLPKSGYQWFAEFAVWGDDVITDAVSFGLVNASASLSTYVGGDANGVGYRVAEGQIHNNGASVQSVTAGAYKDVIGVWLNASDGVNAYVTWFLNGVLLYTYTLPNLGPWYLAASVSNPDTDTRYAWINTGQRAFEFPVAGVDGWFEFADQVPTVRVAWFPFDAGLDEVVSVEFAIYNDVDGSAVIDADSTFQIGEAWIGEGEDWCIRPQYQSERKDLSKMNKSLGGQPFPVRRRAEAISQIEFTPQIYSDAYVDTGSFADMRERMLAFEPCVVVPITGEPFSNSAVTIANVNRHAEFGYCSNPGPIVGQAPRFVMSAQFTAPPALLPASEVVDSSGS